MKTKMRMIKNPRGVEFMGVIIGVVAATLMLIIGFALLSKGESMGGSFIDALFP